MKLTEKPFAYPPVLDGIYFSGKVDLDALGRNISNINNHVQQLYTVDQDVRSAIDEKFEELEHRIKDAMTFLYYVAKCYPHIVHEFSVAERAKGRIGVEGTVTELTFNEEAFQKLFQT